MAKIVEGQVLETRLALTEDWFTVLTANAVHLGKVKGEVSRHIVTAYALMKGLIEDYRINNEYLAAWKELQFSASTSTSRATLQGHSEQLRQSLVVQTMRIKKADAALKGVIAQLWDLLDREGIK